jgi:Fe-S-cluster containining protein
MHVPIPVQGLLVALLLSAPYFGKRILLGFNRDLFSCTRCGKCCGDVVIPLTKEDVRRIEGAGHSGFYTDTWIGTKVMLMRDGKCLFYGNGGCSIYDIRPRICREFPFTKILGVIPYGRTWHYCEGMQNAKRIIG